MGYVVVTGAAGFIGSHLTNQLLERGDRVIGVDSLCAAYDRWLLERNLEVLDRHPGFELLEADISDADAHEVYRGASVIYHLAGRPGVRASWGQDLRLYVEANVFGTQAVIAGAIEGQVPVVFASSSSVYGEAAVTPTPETYHGAPRSPYGMTKLAAEQLLSAYAASFGLRYSALRLFTVFGPRQRPDMAVARFIAGMARGKPIPVFGDGRQLRDMTYVEDAARAFVAAFDAGLPHTVLNIAGGSSASLVDVIEILGDEAGAAAQIAYLEPQAGDVRRTAGDTALARASIGWAPSTSLREGLRAQHAAFSTSMLATP
jgi:UDP-glucuronate 4-epimerase